MSEQGGEEEKVGVKLKTIASRVVIGWQAAGAYNARKEKWQMETCILRGLSSLLESTKHSESSRIKERFARYSREQTTGSGHIKVGNLFLVPKKSKVRN